MRGRPLLMAPIRIRADAAPYPRPTPPSPPRAAHPSPEPRSLPYPLPPPTRPVDLPSVTAVHDPVGAQVSVDRSSIGTWTLADGAYVLARVPVGTHTIRVRLMGYRPDSASVVVTADQRATQDFTLRRDPLQLQTLIVTGTQTPRVN